MTYSELEKIIFENNYNIILKRYNNSIHVSHKDYIVSILLTEIFSEEEKINEILNIINYGIEPYFQNLKETN